MTYYLVDTENVGIRYDNLIDAIKPGDTISFFYTKVNAKRGLSFKMLKILEHSHVTFNVVECVHPGKNALDFQLGTELGALTERLPIDTHFIIYTGDKGLDTLVRYWQLKGVIIDRLTYEPQ